MVDRRNGDAKAEVGADEPLTTEEGRRFVERQPVPPEGRHPATLDLLADNQRDCVEETWWAYHSDLSLANPPTIQKVISATRLLVLLKRKMPPGCTAPGRR